MIPRRGAMAYCSAGCLGIITSSEPQTVAYEAGNTALAWTGFHLRDDPGMGYRIGSMWSSRNPRVVMYVEDVDKILAMSLDAEKCLAAKE